MRPTPYVLGLLATARVAAASPCPVYAIEPHPITPTGSALGPDQGIVVGYWATGQPMEVPHGQPSLDGKTWAFGKIATRIKNLAPGLDVYLGANGEHLDDGHGVHVLDVKRTVTTDPALGAPAVKAIGRYSPANARHPYTITTATLAAAPPAGAIALIAFEATTRAPRSWTRTVSHATDVAIYQSGGCGGIPSGTVDSQVGDQLRFAFVDAGGQVGALSGPVEVKARNN